MTATEAVHTTLSVLAEGLTLAQLTELVCEMFPSIQPPEVEAATTILGLPVDDTGRWHVERRSVC